MKSIFLTLVLTLFFSSVFGQVTKGGFEDNKLNYPDSLNVQEYEHRLQVLASTLDSNHYMYYLERADIRSLAGMFDLALKDFEKAIEKNPEAHMIYFERGSFYMNLQQIEKAKLDYEKALELYPDYDLAKIELGVVYCALEEPEKSNEILIEYLEKAPDSSLRKARLYCLVGQNAKQLNRMDEAIKYFSKCASMVPSHDVYFILGELHMAKGNSKKSIDYFQKVLEEKPDHDLTKLYLGGNYAIMGDYEKALSYLDAYFEKGDEWADQGLLFVYATCLLQAKKYKKALHYFDRLLEMDPKNFNYLKDKGLALYRLKQKKDACNCWFKAKLINPENDDLYRQNCEGKNPMNETPIDKVDPRRKNYLIWSKQVKLSIFDATYIDHGKNTLCVEILDEKVKHYRLAFKGARIAKYNNEDEFVLEVSEGVEFITIIISGFLENEERIELIKQEIGIP